ncbi:MAG: ribosomal RNA small subunit methyltransferase A [Candidatus Aenigmarchaeota archaeon]|nr:ribosomal RNA small subunit methyltransferase A [Candidatus Aenigmarchaeota archaeon]
MIDIASLLKKYDIRPDANLSQHFMANEHVLKEIVKLADIKRGETVLEIGPGLGTLTRMLARKAKKVIAVEIDERLAEILKKELSGIENIEIIQDDILKIMHKLAYDKIVSNTPYMILEPLVHRLSWGRAYKRAVLTLPRHFVKIMTAKHGDDGYSKLSVLCSAFFNMGVKLQPEKADFYPVPGTNNTVIALERKGEGDYRKDVVSYIMKELFCMRGKKVRNALMEAIINCSKLLHGLGHTKNESREAINILGLNNNLLGKTAGQMNINDLKLIINRIEANVDVIKKA